MRDHHTTSTPHLPRLKRGDNSVQDHGSSRRLSSLRSTSNLSCGRRESPEMGPRRITVTTLHCDKPEARNTPSKSARMDRASSSGSPSGTQRQSVSRLPLDSPIKSAKHSARTAKSFMDDSYTLNSFRMSMFSDNKCSTRHSSSREPRNLKMAWDPPLMPQEQYDEIKERRLREGKFKDALTKYFRLEPLVGLKPEVEESDDGYDTDLDSQIGLELIADETARAVKEDGVYPEYKHNCRKYQSVLNTYFLRHCLEDEMTMRYRYLSPGDSKCIATQIQNHLTMSKIDLSDNGVDALGMASFKNMLQQNKHITDLNLSNNNLGPSGARHVRNAMACNYFLLRLDVSGNNFGERGGQYCTEILEDNVSLQELILADNKIGDKSAITMAKALARNSSLKLLDLSWNNIGRKGGVKLAEALKKNKVLETFLAGMNGFGEDGGNTLMASLRKNKSLREVDISANRITDTVVKALSTSINSFKPLTVVKLGMNLISSKCGFELLATIMGSKSSITYIGLEGIALTDEFRGLAHALKTVQGVTVNFEEPPSKRELTRDILTRNLTTIAELLEAEELEVEDIFPDYDEIYGGFDDDDDSDNKGSGNQRMLTTADVLIAMEASCKLSRDKIERLRHQLQYGKKRRFLIGELILVYDKVICGKDPMRDMPLRTHLRRSIKEERIEKEKAAAIKRRPALF